MFIKNTQINTKDNSISKNNMEILSGKYSSNLNSYNLGFISSDYDDLRIILINMSIFLLVVITLLCLYFNVDNILIYYLLVSMSSLAISILLFITKRHFSRYFIKRNFKNDKTYTRTGSGIISFSRMNIDELIKKENDQFIPTHFTTRNKIPNKYPFFIHRDDLISLCKDPYVEVDIFESKNGGRPYISPILFTTKAVYFFDTRDIIDENEYSH